VDREVGLPKIHQRFDLSSKLVDRRGLCFKDPLIPLMPNYPNSCTDNTIPVVYFVVRNSNEPPISPKIRNG